MAGACFGFLLHNRYKASVFMGDTGSLALGGALAAMAACTGMFFPLFISSGIFVLETVSVIMQVFILFHFFHGRTYFLLQKLSMKFRLPHSGSFCSFEIFYTPYHSSCSGLASTFLILLPQSLHDMAANFATLCSLDCFHLFLSLFSFLPFYPFLDYYFNHALMKINIEHSLVTLLFDATLTRF